MQSCQVSGSCSVLRGLCCDLCFTYPAATVGACPVFDCMTSAAPPPLPPAHTTTTTSPAQMRCWSWASRVMAVMAQWPWAAWWRGRSWWNM